MERMKMMMIKNIEGNEGKNEEKIQIKLNSFLAAILKVWAEGKLQMLEKNKIIRNDPPASGIIEIWFTIQNINTYK